MPDHSINAGDIQGRVSDQLFERLEDWRRAQPKIPSRAEALRLLIERALPASVGAVCQPDETPAS
jgi:hypothetical protein